MSNDINVPTPTVAWTQKPLELPLYESWLYCSDIHAPSYAPLMLDRLMRIGRKRNIPTLVIGGDLTDQATISHWPNTLPQHSLEQCLDSAGLVLSLLGDVFERIVVIPGNHDDRTAKKLGSYYSFERLLRSCIGTRRMNADLIATDYSYAYFGKTADVGPDAGVIAGHPSFYSSTAGKGVAEVAEMEHRHVLGSHNHLQAVTWTKSGRYWGVDPGCMCEADNTPYIQRGAGISKYARWKQGFVYLKRNIPTILADGLVDWQDWGAS